MSDKPMHPRHTAPYSMHEGKCYYTKAAQAPLSYIFNSNFFSYPQGEPVLIDYIFTCNYHVWFVFVFVLMPGLCLCIDFRCLSLSLCLVFVFVLMFGLCQASSVCASHLYCLCKWHTPTRLMKTLITIIVIIISIQHPTNNNYHHRDIWWKLSQPSSLSAIFWLTILNLIFVHPHKMVFSQAVLIWVESVDSSNLVTNLQIKEKVLICF